ncbi:MAG: hypothetical protein KC502_07145 [Myxococcales bacterium]|nr:hypothetical protein [Myxococcales bacterium]
MHSVRRCFGLTVAGGPQLAAARLALRGPPGKGLAFAEQWRRAPRRVGRVLCSSALSETWPANRALGLPWGAPLQLGKLTVALGPAGASPESAVLRVQVPEGLMVCALAARDRALPGAEAADVAGADILLLDGAGLTNPATEDAVALLAVGSLAASGGGVIRLDDERLAVALAHVIPPAVQLVAPAGIARRITSLVGRPVRRPTTAPKRGTISLWPANQPLSNPDFPGRLHIHWPGSTPIDGWTGVPWSAQSDEAGLRRLIDRSGASNVVVWHDDADVVRRLDDITPALWHLTSEAQLPLM